MSEALDAVLEARRNRPSPAEPKPAVNGPKQAHELTDSEKEGLFTMYCKPHLWTMEDIRKRWLVTEPTAHYVYDEVEARIRWLRRRGVEPGKSLLS